jgi:hypothetical protein
MGYDNTNGPTFRLAIVWSRDKILHARIEPNNLCASGALVAGKLERILSRSIYKITIMAKTGYYSGSSHCSVPIQVG